MTANKGRRAPKKRAYKPNMPIALPHKITTKGVVFKLKHKELVNATV